MVDIRYIISNQNKVNFGDKFSLENMSQGSITQGKRFEVTTVNMILLL